MALGCRCNSHFDKGKIMENNRFRRRVYSAATVAALLCAGLFGGAAPANAAPAGPCEAFMVIIGVRGTNAPAGSNLAAGGRVWRSGGFGDHVKPVIDTTINPNPDVRAETWVVSLNYPATAEVNLVDSSNAYVNSRDAGVAALKAELESYMACANRPMVLLVGYSQGADVIATTLGGQMNATAKSQVKGAVLFGDPGYLPNQPVNKPGLNPGGIGLFPRDTGVQDTLNSLKSYGYSIDTGGHASRQVVRQYCNANDAVCQSNVVGWGVHSQYGQYVASAAVWLENFVKWG